jgi:hypothetical protein
MQVGSSIQRRAAPMQVGSSVQWRARANVNLMWTCVDLRRASVDRTNGQGKGQGQARVVPHLHWRSESFATKPSQWVGRFTSLRTEPRIGEPTVLEPELAEPDTEPEPAEPGPAKTFGSSTHVGKPPKMKQLNENGIYPKTRNKHRAARPKKKVGAHWGPMAYPLSFWRWLFFILGGF